MRPLTEKEQGELDFWINHYHGGCETELGKTFFEHWPAGATRKLARYRHHLTSLREDADAVWVDVGTGPYSVLMQAPSEVTKIMIDPLVRHYIAHGVLSPAEAPARSIFLTASGEHLPLVDDTADLVACTNALDHVDDPWATISELSRILKPGGFVALEVDTGGVTDFMHPHAMSVAAIDERFASHGLVRVFSEIPAVQGRRRPGALMYHAFFQRMRPAERDPSVDMAIRKAVLPVLVEEGLHGFNIVKLRHPGHGDTYYALLQGDGAFDYERVLANGYQVLFAGKCADDVRADVRRYHRERHSTGF